MAGVKSPQGVFPTERNGEEHQCKQQQGWHMSATDSTRQSQPNQSETLCRAALTAICSNGFQVPLMISSPRASRRVVRTWCSLCGREVGPSRVCP